LKRRVPCAQPHRTSFLRSAAARRAGSSINRVNYGASHGIGHALGAFADVPHGHTSCVMLPHVMRYNARATLAKQRLIAEAVGRPGIPAADAVAELIGRLNQPTTLRAVGVKREQLPKIADAAMHNMWVRTNPQPIRSPQDVMQLLEAAW
jgi:alcohol dehydrogenase class IV